MERRSSLVSSRNSDQEFSDDQLSVLLAEAVVKAHNGKLSFTSTMQAGVGSTCIVILPLSGTHEGSGRREVVNILPSEMLSQQLSIQTCATVAPEVLSSRTASYASCASSPRVAEPPEIQATTVRQANSLVLGLLVDSAVLLSELLLSRHPVHSGGVYSVSQQGKLFEFLQRCINMMTGNRDLTLRFCFLSLWVCTPAGSRARLQCCR